MGYTKGRLLKFLLNCFLENLSDRVSNSLYAVPSCIVLGYEAKGNLRLGNVRTGCRCGMAASTKRTLSLQQASSSRPLKEKEKLNMFIIYSTLGHIKIYGLKIIEENYLFGLAGVGIYQCV